MTTSSIAIIPVRSLSEGKTRLSPQLNTAARQQIIARMLSGVIRAALDCTAIDRVIVVSPDRVALSLAGGIDRRVIPLAQPIVPGGLMSALDQARETALTLGAGQLLVVFGDLPLLSSSELGDMFAIRSPVVIAPDRHGTGTNALLLRAAAGFEIRAFHFKFGAASFTRHESEARRLEQEPAISRAPGTMFDLDTPEDLLTLLKDDRWANLALEPGADSLLEQAS